MKNINVLDSAIANMIAAGEVVERPASVVKELVENAIDAGATMITVEIERGGVSKIAVMDNGSGIEKEDVPYAFLRHATSKIKSESDLEAIYTLGFRGEALASIAAVSKIEISTKRADDHLATYMEMEAGEICDISERGAADGTSITIRDLFFNTPARMKFLKKDATEAGYIGDIMLRFALSHPNVSFKLIDNQRQRFFTPGDNNLANCIYVLYGKEYSDAVVKVDYKNEYAKVSGAVIAPGLTRKNRNYQSLFVNKRYIKSAILSAAVQEAYKEKIVSGNFPVFCLNIEINPILIDVNVHPSKLEVKFSNEKQIFDVAYWGVKNALSQNTIPYLLDISAKKVAFTPPKISFGGQYVKKNAVSKGADCVGEESSLQKSFVFKESEEHEISGHHEPLYVGSSVQFVKQVSDHLQTEDAQKGERGTILVPETEQTALQLGEKRADDYKIIGQLFHTYILLESCGEMLVIDQHAAHERLNFEKLTNNYMESGTFSQMLISPITVDLSSVEYAKAMENIEFFMKIGFDIDDFGNNAIIVRSSPIGFNSLELKDLFLDVLDMMGNRKSDMTRKTENALHMIACKASIRANDAMQMGEMEALVRDVFALKNANTCPHGRPIVLTITKKDIEKGFKRIV